jgi:hypothetical protein
MARGVILAELVRDRTIWGVIVSQSGPWRPVRGRLGLIPIATRWGLG